MACERGIGAQKGHPLIGLFGLREDKGYGLKFRDFNYKGISVKVEGREIAHLAFSHQFVEPLQGVGVPSVQVPNAEILTSFERKILVTNSSIPVNSTQYSLH